MLIPNSMGKCGIEYTTGFECICRINETPMWGSINIFYEPKENLIEWGAFEEWVIDQADLKTTAEEFCRLVFDMLWKLLPESYLTVGVEADSESHGTIKVTCSSFDEEEDSPVE